MGFSAETSEHGGMPVLHLADELDPASQDELESLITTQVGHVGGRLILDLRDVTYLDSSTLGLFIRLEYVVSARSGALALACPQPDVKRLLGVTGLLSRLHVFDNLDEAATYLDALGRPEAL